MRAPGPAPFLKTLLFVLFALGAVFLPLIPLGLVASSMAMPDLIYALVAAWMLRNPASAPLLLVAAVLLVADFMLSRPPGLWALLVLLGSEYLRSQRDILREQVFIIEWLTVTVVLVVLMVMQEIILLLALLPRPGLGLQVEHLIITAFAYPVVVGTLHWIFHIRAPKPTERSSRLGRVT